jgi:hypothetical protein
MSEPTPVATPTNQEIEDSLRRDVIALPPGEEKWRAVNALICFLQTAATAKPVYGE